MNVNSKNQLKTDMEIIKNINENLVVPSDRSMEPIPELEPILEKYGLTEILYNAYNFYMINHENSSAQLVKSFYNSTLKKF